MEVKYCLSCTLFIVLYNVISVASKNICQLTNHPLRERQNLCRLFVLQVIQIPVMLFRNDQRMSFLCGAEIKDHPEVVIFIKCCRRNLPCRDLTEYTIFFFHDNPSFLPIISDSSIDHFLEKEKPALVESCRIDSVEAIYLPC